MYVFLFTFWLSNFNNWLETFGIGLECLRICVIIINHQQKKRDNVCFVCHGGFFSRLKLESSGPNLKVGEEK